MAHTIIDKQSGELAFRLDSFEDVSQFDHVQRKNYYSMILMPEAEHTLVVDVSEYHLQGQIMVCLSPYQPFMFKMGKECRGVILSFHPDFFCTYRHQNEIETEGVLFSNFQTPPFFKVEEVDHFKDLISQMTKEIERNTIAQHEVLVAFLKVFLIEAVRQRKKYDKDSLPKSSSRHLQVLHELMDAIEGNYSQSHAPKDYADMLCVSAKTLGGIVKKHLNQTTTTLITNRIVIEAKRELYLTSKTVKEVASLLGYEDEFYFSRVFKKNVGVSPDIYRKTVGFAKLES